MKELADAKRATIELHSELHAVSKRGRIYMTMMSFAFETLVFYD